VVDRDGSIIYVNPSADSLLGLARKDLIGTKGKELPLSMYYREGEMRPSRRDPHRHKDVDLEQEQADIAGFLHIHTHFLLPGRFFLVVVGVGHGTSADSITAWSCRLQRSW
jgi:PAS domain-containing protein